MRSVSGYLHFNARCKCRLVIVHSMSFIMFYVSYVQIWASSVIHLAVKKINKVKAEIKKQKNKPKTSTLNMV